MKLFRLISTAIAAAAISAVCAVSAAAQNVPLDRISDSITMVQTMGLKAARMTKSRTVKNVLFVGEDEALVIPDGCKLTVKNGLAVYGTLYIEEGGYLAVSGGTLSIKGSVVSDGTVAIGSKAGLYTEENSELFISETGTLKISSTDSEWLKFDALADTVCGGKLITPRSNKNYADTLCAKPVLAIKTVYQPLTGIRRESSVHSAEEIAGILPEAGDYISVLPVVDYATQVSVIYDNGCCVKYTLMGDKIYGIGNAEIFYIMDAFETGKGIVIY